MGQDSVMSSDINRGGNAVSRMTALFKRMVTLSILDEHSIKIRSIFAFTVMFVVMAIFLSFYLYSRFEGLFLEITKKEGIAMANIFLEKIVENKMYRVENGKKIISSTEGFTKLFNIHKKNVDIIKVNIYNMHSIRIFTTDPKSTQSSLKDKLLVEKVLSTGKPKVEIEEKENPRNKHQKRHILELFVPTDFGVFEFYQEVTSHVAQHKQWRLVLVFSVIVFLCISYLILYLLFRQIKERENELIHQKDLAESANQMKDNFMAKVSHEIKNPLNIILGFGELIKLRTIEMDQGEITDVDCRKMCQEDVRAILEGGKSIKQFVNDILNFQKAKSGSITIRPEPIAVTEIIKGLESYAKIALQSKDIVFKVHHDKKIDVVTSDSVRLNQVLTNLLSNAIKFTHQGSVSLTVTEYERDKIVFRITDTGIGISQAEKDRVFDEFYQVEGSMGGSSHGFGLGLAITRQLVYLLKGEISVESQPNQGTTFSVVLPAAKD